jgi:hypothetical protein
MFRRTSASFFAACLCLALGACAAVKTGQSLPRQHPEKLGKGNPVCTECHEAPAGGIVYARFNHDPGWTRTHAGEARQGERVCSLCHAQSFCNDCHVSHSELKPPIKNQTDTYRNQIHRGDYLSRHRIDARIDPASCFRCHGNPKSSKLCVPCHGK